MNERVEAPWDDDQVASLNAYQQCDFVHPFTGERGPNNEETVLIATKDGWVEKEGGPVVQTWAHRFMTDRSWEAMTSWNLKPSKIELP